MIGATRLKKCSSGSDDMATNITVQNTLSDPIYIYLFLFFFCITILYLLLF